MPITINLKSAVFAVSDALDLVGVSDFQHGKRVAMIARETALQLGLPEARVENLVFTGLLHDMGVSSTAEHRRLVSEDPDVDRQAHCERAFHLMQPFAHLSLLANAVRHHHTPWTELPADLGEADAIDSNLILLADRVDTLLLRHGLENPLFHSTDICREISALSGSVLQPDVVDAFLAAPALGQNTHMAISQPLKAAGVAIDKLTIAPFRSSGESITALLGGHVDVVSATAPVIMPQVKAGKLRVLASAAAQPGTGALAGIKTWREQGVAADYVSYNGVMLAPGVNAEQIRFWEDALRRVSQDKTWQAMVEQSGNRPIFRGYVESHRYLMSEWQAATELATSLGLKGAR